MPARPWPKGRPARWQRVSAPVDQRGQRGARPTSRPTARKQISVRQRRDPDEQDAGGDEGGEDRHGSTSLSEGTIEILRGELRACPKRLGIAVSGPSIGALRRGHNGSVKPLHLPFAGSQRMSASECTAGPPDARNGREAARVILADIPNIILGNAALASGVNPNSLCRRTKRLVRRRCWHPPEPIAVRVPSNQALATRSTPPCLFAEVALDQRRMRVGRRK